MNIMRVSSLSTPAFKAQTKISAPENLLSKKDREYFEELGKKYKTPQDTIQIEISNLHATENKPEVQCYTVSKLIKDGTSVEQSKKAIPYIKNGVPIENNSPKNYLTKTFNTLLSR